MNAIQNEPSELAPSAQLTPSPPLLRTLVACDLVESTALTEQLGDRNIADFMHQLDRHARDLLQRHGGVEIDKTDGFLLMFERPAPAVAFALDYQRMLHNLSLSEFLPLKARIGIHVGDVVLWRNTASDVARGAKPVEVEGLVKPVASRLMSLALPGQILLSGVARALALRAQDELETEFPPEWRMHGRYVFKGVAEPVPVFEIGEEGIAPLRSPAYSSKAFREVPWFRRPALLAIEAAVVLAAIVIPAWIFLRSPPVIAFADRDWVVVGNLKNLTDEHRFDEALETGFRLGLEQSHYVNVMSDLKVRDTIAMMQRDAEQTPIDRIVGSEVAIRDGARALIIPTVAEVGHRVRVTAEVIDPNTQTTVYTESAEGVGADSVLSSIDSIDQRLRERLGEALASVAKDSQPLDKVATKNLDALRAYSLGQRSYSTGDMKHALSFYETAVRLDPQFALAHIAIARVHWSAGEFAEELEHVQAAATRDRLSPRDALFVDAWLTNLTKPHEALDKWTSLIRIYPDFYLATGAYSYYAWNANRYDDAISAALLNAAPQNPKAAAGSYLLGILFLSKDRFSEAVRQFQRAAELGFARNDFYSLVYAAQRKFDKAHSLLDSNKPSGRAADDFGTEIVRLAVLSDEGRWQDVHALLAKAKNDAEKAGPRSQRQLEGIDFALQSVTGKLDQAALEKYARAESSAATNNAEDHSQALFHAVFAAYLLARDGASERAGRLLADLEGPVVDLADGPLNNLLAMVKAEVACSKGHPETATALLAPLVDGNELYLTHLTLLDAYSSQNDRPAALREADWLASHRGRAYGEYGAQQFLTGFNIAQSNIALLRVSEMKFAEGDSNGARDAFQQFIRQWPQANLPAALAKRARTITAAL